MFRLHNGWLHKREAMGREFGQVSGLSVAAFNANLVEIREGGLIHVGAAYNPGSNQIFQCCTLSSASVVMVTYSSRFDFLFWTPLVKDSSKVALGGVV